MASNKKRITFEQYESLQSELATCQRKLKSKEEAVRILHSELELCQEEKEEFSRLMNHMKDYYFEGHSLHQTSFEDDSSIDLKDPTVDKLEAMIKQMKQKHKEEIQSLKDKLSQTRGSLVTSSASPSTSSDIAEERSMLVSQLESAQSQILSLIRQVQSLEDEKEEVLTERDAFSAKCSKFSKMLEESDNSKPPSQSTLEKLLDENRQLKMELLETQADRDSAVNKIDRYKRTIDRKMNRETQNQAIQFMNSDKLSALRQSVRRVQELEMLANSLSEELKEKSLALSHLRKTNRLLGTRIAELEHRLKVLEISGLWSTPDTNGEKEETGEEPKINWEEEEEESNYKGDIVLKGENSDKHEVIDTNS